MWKKRKLKKGEIIDKRIQYNSQLITAGPKKKEKINEKLRELKKMENQET